jgi:protein-tyrosine phosphatase
MPEAVTRIVRDSKFRMHVQGVANKAECCYYPLEEDYTPEVSLCDEITRKYSLRMLKESGRVQFYE